LQSDTVSSAATGMAHDSQPTSKQLAITLANLESVDASIVHSLGVAADTAEALSNMTPDADALASMMLEFAQCTQTIGTLLHDEIDKLGGPIAMSVAQVAYALPVGASSAHASSSSVANAPTAPPQASHNQGGASQEPLHATSDISPPSGAPDGGSTAGDVQLTA